MAMYLHKISGARIVRDKIKKILGLYSGKRALPKRHNSGQNWVEYGIDIRLDTLLFNNSF
jgi:hypothetical protein